MCLFSKTSHSRTGLASWEQYQVISTDPWQRLHIYIISVKELDCPQHSTLVHNLHSQSALLERLDLEIRPLHSVISL